MKGWSADPQENGQETESSRDPAGDTDPPSQHASSNHLPATVVNCVRGAIEARGQSLRRRMVCSNAGSGSVGC